MMSNWTFGRKIATGLTVVVVLIAALGAVSVAALSSVVASKDHVINVDSRDLIEAKSLNAAYYAKSAAVRGYLLTGDPIYLRQMTQAHQTFLATVATIRHNGVGATANKTLTTILDGENSKQTALDALLALRRQGAPAATVEASFTALSNPAHQTIEGYISTFIGQDTALLVADRQASTDNAGMADDLILLMALLAIGIALALTFSLPRTLRRQIGTAVSEVSNSSIELQATANQQATGAREQATAISEITTTISELLTTSRQIAEGAQRVAQVAQQTAGAGRAGEQTLSRAQAYIDDVRRQVDIVVNHMLQLGEKSQRIGAVLDIVAELAEQSNILAINSTIEAAGAGEAGKRFAVVADEIRKLADRVADSTKEIRELIDVVRGAVNMTVMATEIGSKAVDAGNEQFVDVASTFDQIANLVETTNEAAREIELSTKQQTTAVEQVNVAIADVAQTTKETEASTSQTLQTASQLAGLSQELARLVVAQPLATTDA